MIQDRTVKTAGRGLRGSLNRLGPPRRQDERRSENSLGSARSSPRLPSLPLLPNKPIVSVER